MIDVLVLSSRDRVFNNELFDCTQTSGPCRHLSRKEVNKLRGKLKPPIRRKRGVFFFDWTSRKQRQRNLKK